MNGSIAIVQGLYFLITGVWPLISFTSFEKVTGPKTDQWLVKTVGVLVAVIGLALVHAGVKEEINSTVTIIAGGSAASLAAVDVIYVSKRVIPPIYLLDAVVEFLFIMWWTIAS